MGFFTGETIPDTTSASVRLNVKDPTHPIFAGINLDASSNMVGAYSHIATFYGTGSTATRHFGEQQSCCDWRETTRYRRRHRRPSKQWHRHCGVSKGTTMANAAPM